MLFNSFEFIFVFLPVALAGYFILARFARMPNAHIAWLGFVSLAFYAYWDYRFLPVILVSITANFICGVLMGRVQSHTVRRRALFIFAVAGNLIALGAYKYLNFGIEIINKLAHTSIGNLSIVLPLGISFFTFTQIAYLFDVYYGHSRERNFLKYLLFVSYFPHLIAGPILHHKEMMPQFGGEASKRFSSLNMAIGVTVFAIGLFKKVVVADGFALIANPIFKAAAVDGVGTLDAWSGALAYSLQIYFDFSGYSDMAIGLSCMFGIKLPFNFDSPYKARSIVEFWRRWHITLSRFLRDYLYIPLGGNRGGEARHHRNLMITMVLGGLWHGAGWTYVAWGFLHGVFLTINHVWRGFVARVAILSRFSGSMVYGMLSFVLTQVCVVIAWVYFRADHVRTAGRIIGAMFGGGKQPPADAIPFINWFPLCGIAIAYLACFVLPNVNALFERRDIGLQTYKLNRPFCWPRLAWHPGIVWAVVFSLLFMISVIAILIAGDGTQFLYFQF